ncbi:MAG: DUF1501 domain-containing protein [Actinomycetota bacterium]
MTNTSTIPSRRDVLRGLTVSAGAGAVMAAGAGTASGILPKLASPAGAAVPQGRVVVVFLRGGIDGLSAVVPYTEQAYYDARPSISIPSGAVTDLDGQFGLHPALAPLYGLYTAGRFAVLNAVGNPAMNRSHFEAQAYWEQGSAGHSNDGFGWIARHLLSSTGLPGADFRAVGLGANTVRALAGYQDSLIMASLDQFVLGANSPVAQGFEIPLRLLHSGDAPVEVTGTITLDALDEIAGLVGGGGGGTPTYNNESQAFEDARTLLGGGLGIEVITINMGGWDTHDSMGDETGGEMYDLLDGLATNLSNFQAGLDADGHGDVTTIVMSEFGRRVNQNGSGGTDHGFGNAMFAMGGGIAGNQVLGTWPGLTNLANGDLDMTTDFRDVLSEVVADRLGNANLGSVFPDFTPTPVGLTV